MRFGATTEEELSEDGDEAEQVPARLEEEGGTAVHLSQLFEFLDRFEDYHPSHLVAWLQARLVTIEELPMAPTAPFQDHYDKLDLPCDADPASIRRAYRKLALATHPDKPHGDRILFEEVARAYAVLSDPQQREVYDVERMRVISGTPEVVGDVRVCRFLRLYGSKVAEGLAESDILTLRKGIINLEPDDVHAWLDSVRLPFSPVLVPGFGETEEGHTAIFASPGFFKAQEFVSHTMDNNLMLVRAGIPATVHMSRTHSTGLEWMMKRVDDRSCERRKVLYSIKVIDAQQLGRETLQMMNMYCDHDILMLVANAPWVVRLVVMFASTFMSKRQTARIKYLGSASEAEVQAQLRLVGPRSMFPPSLGGIPLYLPLAQEDASGAMHPEKTAEEEAATKGVKVKSANKIPKGVKVKSANKIPKAIPSWAPDDAISVGTAKATFDGMSWMQKHPDDCNHYINFQAGDGIARLLHPEDTSDPQDKDFAGWHFGVCEGSDVHGWFPARYVKD